MVNTIDLNFLGTEHVIASYLLKTAIGPILIETGPYSTFQTLSKGIEAAGYKVEDIKHVFLTHIHLDHAGAAWAFAEHGAKIYVHPVGVKHLVDPSKLMASATRIYQDQMDRLWGAMHPISTDQIVAVGHEESMDLNGQHIVAWHTPGHATHHIAWQIAGKVWTGDVAGVKIGDGLVVPPCPPPDINIEDWVQSIKLLTNLNPQEIYLAHFGKVTNPLAHFQALEQQLYNWANWIKVKFEAQQSIESITPEFKAYVKQQLEDHGIIGAAYEKYESANPAWMSVGGLMRYWKKKHTN